MTRVDMPASVIDATTSRREWLSCVSSHHLSDVCPTLSRMADALIPPEAMPEWRELVSALSVHGSVS
jgi:hypothetical protein